MLRHFWARQIAEDPVEPVSRTRERYGEHREKENHDIDAEGAVLLVPKLQSSLVRRYHVAVAHGRCEVGR